MNDMSSILMLTMQKAKSTRPSEQRARVLLSVWNTGDLRRLRETLAQEGMSQGGVAGPAGGAAERERMEMLETIADAMRNWLRRGGEAPMEDLQVSVRLLRHLAGFEQLWRERSV